MKKNYPYYLANEAVEGRASLPVTDKFTGGGSFKISGFIIGDVPSWRADNMPYGGVKESGLGREGVRFAMEEMTEIRLMVLRSPADR